MKKFSSIKDILAHDKRLVRLPAKGRAVFVGDTHGDFDATQKVFRLYFKPGFVLVFLGDYVDRGEKSMENLEFLLERKAEAPERVFLLAGNHEGYCIMPFSPADFWEGLPPEEYEYFSEVCKFFSFAAITQNGLMAVHGATADLGGLDEIDKVELCSEQWMQFTWGDFMEQPGEFLGDRWGRPAYGEDYFNRTMSQFGVNVLIRSHQPNIRPVIYQKRCITLMTSHYYASDRRVAVVDLERPEINSVADLEIREI